MVSGPRMGCGPQWVFSPIMGCDPQRVFSPIMGQNLKWDVLPELTCPHGAGYCAAWQRLSVLTPA